MTAERTTGFDRELGAPLSPQTAAYRAVAPDALLDGEDPDSVHADDADHWISVYGELIAFKERVLATTTDEIAELDHGVSRGEARQVDVTVLKAELERFRRRLDFWQRRRAELGRGESS